MMNKNDVMYNKDLILHNGLKMKLEIILLVSVCRF